eukprot:TRINITY_DN2671_c0_g1_i1.p1 TRINITY_DN2671_c0_g1~~TRINITY_DN2671_c0_g1_i1.p1  ORF type:complete len:264 (-),score=57.27 TRINITY_DN2671_c0_g1_i1:43-834(-)
MSHTCVVQTETGVVREDTVSVQVGDIYIQEVTNLQIETMTGGTVRLSWETSHTRIADESFIISVYNVGTPVQLREIVTTERLEYFASELSYNTPYLFRIQVVNRLNNTDTYQTLYYINTQSISTAIQPNVAIITGVIAGVIIVLLSIIICVCLIVVFVQKKKIHKFEYTNRQNIIQPSNVTSGTKEYIQLSEVENTGHSSNTAGYQLTHDYEPMKSVVTRGQVYVNLETAQQPNYSADSKETTNKTLQDTVGKNYENLANVSS